MIKPVKFEIGETVFTTYCNCRSVEKIVKKFIVETVCKGSDTRQIYVLTLEHKINGTTKEYICDIDSDEFYDEDSNAVCISRKRIPLKRKNKPFVLYD